MLNTELSSFYDTVVNVTQGSRRARRKEVRLQELRRVRKRILDQAEKGSTNVVILMDTLTELSLNDLIEEFDERFYFKVTQGSEDEPEVVQIMWQA